MFRPPRGRRAVDCAIERRSGDVRRSLERSAFTSPRLSCLTMRLHMPQWGGALPGLLARSWTPRRCSARSTSCGGIRGGPPDLTVACMDSLHVRRSSKAVRDVDGVGVDGVADCTFLMQRAAGSRSPETADQTRDGLSMAYTRVGIRACAARRSPGLDAVDRSHALDSQARVEHRAAVRHASHRIQISLDDLWRFA